ncbi:MAG: hypothetical protein Q8M79_12340 [Dehalococcoidia bacterium]|nr:hypothetical protein [Dehalococcoidia bacterium]
MPGGLSPRRSPEPRSLKRALLRLDLRRGTPDQIGQAVQAMLDETDMPLSTRVELLGGLIVVESLRPYWRDGRTAHEAHEALRQDDPELADAIEALAPMLLGRAQAREDAAAAIEAIEALLGPSAPATE